MSLIFHTANLLVGQRPKAALAAFFDGIREKKPNLVILSGNLTAQAQKESFEELRAWIEGTGVPFLSIPGPRDYSASDLLRKYIDPLQAYRQFINPVEDTIYDDSHVHIVGVNTAFSIAPSMRMGVGVVRQDQIAFADYQFRAAPQDKARILVSHHSLIPARGTPSLVWGGTDLLGMLERQNIDLALCAGYVPHADAATYPFLCGCPSGGGGHDCDEKVLYNMIKVQPAEISIELALPDGTFRRHTLTRTLPQNPD